MKKIIMAVLAVLAIAFTAQAADVKISFEHDGLNTDGYYCEYHPQADPSITGTRVVTGNTVREIVLEDESRFYPCVPYVFTAIAFAENPYRESPPASVIWENIPVEGCPEPPTPQNIGDYTAPGNPSEVQLIQIWK
jgi:hypothetical protein